ncbi:uncharacterized protein TA13740 [Theileria annulata]|uniref:Uncharacterized protein n=1 Tax=Theileria annulata TaxID=5874 RepID=Q4UDC7_THEAN|nr:uncharacterized protein TA13740 [Theileria annulata]CAI74912.1 hypothetical protein TA13740 [Theileria annulata]|eukprot:XP_952644.1 hypothetical protein TA13740 [Theileria annulata]
MKIHMEINRTHSRNTVLGINSVILEEDPSDSLQTDELPRDSSASSKYGTDPAFEKGKKYEGPISGVKYENGLPKVQCVAIIEDVEKMFDMNDSQIVTRTLENTASIDSSNPPSFSSFFNSVIPITGGKNRFDLADSNMSCEGTNFSNINNVSSNLEAGSNTLTAKGELDKPLFLSLNELSSDASPLTKSERGPNKEVTLSSALLLGETYTKFNQEFNRKKVPPAYENFNAHHLFRLCPMPSCYVISKDDYFNWRRFSTLQASFEARASRLNRHNTSSHLNYDSTFMGNTVANTPNSNVTNSKYTLDHQLAHNSSFVPNSHNMGYKSVNSVNNNISQSNISQNTNITCNNVNGSTFVSGAIGYTNSIDGSNLNSTNTVNTNNMIPTNFQADKTFEKHMKLGSKEKKMRNLRNGSMSMRNESLTMKNRAINSIGTGTQLLRGNSMVSVVNKGSSSMLILKIQSYTKNYMDINPDFGWRRLIDDKNLPFSNFSNNTYMFYIESKKSTHIISLGNLAINIACRAFILAVTHGYLDHSLVPSYLLRYLPNQTIKLHESMLNSPSTNTQHNQLDNNKLEKPDEKSKADKHNEKAKQDKSNEKGKLDHKTSEKNKLDNVRKLPKHYYYKGGVDYTDEECGRETMYLKSNFLGIFAISSLVRNLVSEKYKNRYQRNKKDPAHSVDFFSTSTYNRSVDTPSFNNVNTSKSSSTITSDHSTSGANSNSVNNSMDEKSVNTPVPNTYYNSNNSGNGFYKYVPIPEYGWKLVSKAPHDVREDPRPDGLSKFFSRLFKRKPRFETLYPNTLLCKVNPPLASESNNKIMVDAGSLGMNLAEQLYRLEISTQNREKFPKNTFGFSSHNDKVTCPDGTVFEFVPEEVILNTASLIHEIYITQTYLIL